MSAFDVSDAHIRYLVAAYDRYGYPKASFDELEGFAVMLRNANTQSMCARYADNEGDLISTFPIAGFERIRVTAIQTIKAIHCMEYQSCETSDWTESPAYDWLRDLEHAAARDLDGWDEARWDIEVAWKVK